MYNAGAKDALSRHNNELIASAAAKKPLPNTVTGVPPSITPCAGDRNDTATATAYMKLRPLVDHCCPFIDTSTDRWLAPFDGGVKHSI
jgi:hypothetical protein